MKIERRTQTFFHTLQKAHETKCLEMIACVYVHAAHAKYTCGVQLLTIFVMRKRVTKCVMARASRVSKFCACML